MGLLPLLFYVSSIISISGNLLEPPVITFKALNHQADI